MNFFGMRKAKHINQMASQICLNILAITVVQIVKENGQESKHLVLCAKLTL